MNNEIFKDLKPVQIHGDALLAITRLEQKIASLESKLQAGRVPPYIVLAMEAALKAFIDEWGRKLISFKVLAQAEKAYNEYQLYKEQEALKSSEEKGLV